MFLNSAIKSFVTLHRTWRILRDALSKSGCILVTVPSLEEATLFNSEVGYIMFHLLLKQHC